LKIFQLLQKPQLRGAEIFAAQLSDHLQNLGHGVTLITLFEGAARLPFQGKIIHLARPLNKRFWDLTGWKQLAALMKAQKPDIIQANAGDTLKFAVLSKLLFGWNVPIVFRNANLMSGFIDSRLKWYSNRFLLGRVAHVISVSKTCSTDLAQYFGYPPGNITTVEIGINLNPIGPRPADVADIFKRGPVFINVAGFVPEKNHAGLLQIFSMLVHRLPQAQLILIGKGKGEEQVEQQIEALGLAQNVHRLGARTDVLEIMQGCSAFLLPSHIEGLPGVVLEAMYARCPVVAYEVGGLGEVILDQVTGRLIAKDDTVGFVAAVLDLVQKESETQAICAAAYERVTSTFDNRTIATRFESVYKQIARK
jgi:glycosyltransferase involved in cell wall biosynthesis